MNDGQIDWDRWTRCSWDVMQSSKSINFDMRICLSPGTITYYMCVSLGSVFPLWANFLTYRLLWEFSEMIQLGQWITISERAEAAIMESGACGRNKHSPNKQAYLRKPHVKGINKERKQNVIWQFDLTFGTLVRTIS